jgi:hypothetical protein
MSCAKPGGARPLRKNRYFVAGYGNSSRKPFRKDGQKQKAPRRWSLGTLALKIDRCLRSPGRRSCGSKEDAAVDASQKDITIEDIYTFYFLNGFSILVYFSLFSHYSYFYQSISDEARTIFKEHISEKINTSSVI